MRLCATKWGGGVMKLYKNKTSVLVVWAVLFYCFPVLAVKLNGVVVNGEDSRVPVVNALVSVGHSSVKTTTDSEGKFSLRFQSWRLDLDKFRDDEDSFLGNQRLLISVKLRQWSAFRFSGLMDRLFSGLILEQEKG